MFCCLNNTALIVCVPYLLACMDVTGESSFMMTYSRRDPVAEMRCCIIGFLVGSVSFDGAPAHVRSDIPI